MSAEKSDTGTRKTVRGDDDLTVQYTPGQHGPIAPAQPASPTSDGTANDAASGPSRSEQAADPTTQPTLHFAADQEKTARAPLTHQTDPPAVDMTWATEQPSDSGSAGSDGGSAGTEATAEMQTQDAGAFNKRRKSKQYFKRLGRFEIERVLGEGAFGTVYLAHDPQLDRQVALKVAKTGIFATPSDRARFLREARAAAQLRHPNIVPVYEFGQIDDIIYIAFQYIEGKSLKRVLRREGKMSPDRAVEILEKLASALHYAHQQGIVHRDMKPDNVLIDARGEPHITDFGCARRDDGEIRQTLEGAIMGTPAYMSPEQAAGRSYQADRRSDVWSLGVMFDEMLTGVLPFQGTLTEVLMQIRERDARPLRQIDSSIPKDLETICAKCLAKNPDERFAEAGDLAAELQRYQRGEPILSRPIGVVGRTWRWARRNRLVASLLVTVFLTLSTGLGISTFLYLDGRRQQWLRTLAQVDALRTASPQSVTYLLSNLEPFRREVLPHISEQLTKSSAPSELTRLRIAMMALGDPEQPKFADFTASLLEDMLRADPDEFLVLRETLAPHVTAQLDTLWQTATDGSQPKASRFRAACGLALYDPDSERWPQVAADVVGQLVTENRVAIQQWVQALAPVKNVLRPLLEQEFSSGENDDKRTIAAAVLADLYADDLNTLIPLVLNGEPAQLAELLRQLQRRPIEAIEPLLAVSRAGDESESSPTAWSASQVANAEVALLALGRPDRVWKRLGENREPAIRNWILHRLGAVGVDPGLIKEHLTQIHRDGAPLEIAGLLLALGQFDPGQLYVSERGALLPQLTEIYATHPHPAVHSASRWLLDRWGFTETLDDSHSGDNIVAESDEPCWTTGPMGHKLVVLGPVDSFRMGAEPGTSSTLDVQQIHLRRLPRRFAISTREVTVGDFHRYETERLEDLARRIEAAEQAGDKQTAQHLKLLREDLERRQLNRRGSRDPKHPIVDITWFEAAAYCYWLGQKEGLTDEQQCYPPIDRIEEMYARFEPLLIDPKKLDLPGYRLPTVGEWEYACRAGTESLRPFGDIQLAANYAWTADNARDATWPVGLLKPNDFGLFDVIGNSIEWCHDWKLDTPEPGTDGHVLDGADNRRGALRELRGGSFKEFISDVHSAVRGELRAEQGDETVGFRIARTIVPAGAE